MGGLAVAPTPDGNLKEFISYTVYQYSRGLTTRNQAGALRRHAASAPTRAVTDREAASSVTRSYRQSRNLPDARKDAVCAGYGPNEALKIMTPDYEPLSMASDLNMPLGASKFRTYCKVSLPLTGTVKRSWRSAIALLEIIRAWPLATSAILCRRRA